VKRLIACVSLVALTSAAVSAAPASHAVAKPAHKHRVVAIKARVAPADEYFGRLKMSILGIRNTIRDAGLRVDADSQRATAYLGQLPLTEDAIHDWERKYPADNWLPGTLFALERLYAKVDNEDARQHAKTTMVWLVHDFPRSTFAATGKKELAQNLVGKPPAPPASAPETSASP
jgi:hypothetical protein